ncbi:MAG: hypothetical protein DRP23_04380 [Thermotogae bacterium]|nr:MAG: hypothetical protein DRP23_04380 [Thermotogota bacterium]
MRKLGIVVFLIFPYILFASVSISLKNGAGIGWIGCELEYRFQDHYAFFGGFGTTLDTFTTVGGFRYYFLNEFESGPFVSLGGGVLPISIEETTEIVFPVPIFLATGGYAYHIVPNWKISAEIGLIGGIVVIIPIVSPTFGVSIGYTF